MGTLTWKAGTADEAWKVVICARDVKNTETALVHIASVLGKAGSPKTIEQRADCLRGLTGDQIADALVDFHRSRLQSVENAIKKKVTNEAR